MFTLHISLSLKKHLLWTIVTIETYLGAIGNVYAFAQLGLKLICKDLTVGSKFFGKNLSCLLKPAPFTAILVYLRIALLIAGDIESNLGPYNLDSGLLRPLEHSRKVFIVLCYLNL